MSFNASSRWYSFEPPATPSTFGSCEFYSRRRDWVLGEGSRLCSAIAKLVSPGCSLPVGGGGIARGSWDRILGTSTQVGFNGPWLCRRLGLRWSGCSLLAVLFRRLDLWWCS
ncbi:hypothetical protein Trydic_g6196 [Trypoxylus dichotomus]